MKKLLFLLSAFLLAGLLSSAAASTSYELDAESGVLLITGSGNMPNYSQAGSPWYGSSSLVKEIIVEDGVTSVGSGAFYGLSCAVSAQLPDSVVKIGKNAFSGCQALSITLPDGIVSVGADAFEGVPQLLCEPLTATSAVLAVIGCPYASPAQPQLLLSEADGVISVAGWSGGDFVRLPSYVSVWENGRAGTVILPQSLGSGCRFSLCAEAVILPDGVESAGTLELSGTELLFLPDSLSGLTGIVLSGCSPLVCCESGSPAARWAEENGCARSSLGPGRTHFLENGRCLLCGESLQFDGLETLILPEGTVSVGEEAFLDTSAELIRLPDSCVSIAPRAFADCAALRYVSLPLSLAARLPDGLLEGSTAELVFRLSR